MGRKPNSGGTVGDGLAIVCVIFGLLVLFDGPIIPLGIVLAAIIYIMIHVAKLLGRDKSQKRDKRRP